MLDLLELSTKKIASVPVQFKRYLADKIDWDARLIGIKGARGTGKTTLILQWLRNKNLSPKTAAYFSLDDLYFTQHKLTETIKDYYLHGGRVVALDEVHKYSGWSLEIKNLYDRYEDLQIIFTGSSILEITKQEADLSRRALMYELWGLSYREHLQYVYGLEYPILKLEQLLSPHFKVEQFFPTNFRPFQYFQEYLQNGYFPFGKNDLLNYRQRLRQLVRGIIENDMAEVRGFDIRHAKKLLQLMYVVAQQVPFKPNLQNLAAKTGIHRNSINNYLYFLHEARLIYLLQQAGSSVATLQKPEKIYLACTDLMFALAETPPSRGTIREVFLNSQLNVIHQVNHSSIVDFTVDNKYHFEVGGKYKKSAQTKEIKNAWIVKDEVEYPVNNVIPIWLFGFLY